MSSPSEPVFLLPNALIQDKEIHHNTRRLGAVLYSFGGNEVKATLAELKAWSGISITTIRKSRLELEERGYIRLLRGSCYMAPVYLLTPTEPGTSTAIPLSTLFFPLSPAAYTLLLNAHCRGWKLTGAERPSLSTIKRALGGIDASRALKEIRAVLEEKKT